MTPEIMEVVHGSAAWTETVRLRHDVLRAPLGLEFSADELAAEDTQLHFAAYADGALAGVGVLAPPGAAWKLRQMAVAAGRRGRGIGAALVAAAEAAVRARGGTEVVLHARETAVPFYARLGYSAEGPGFMEVTIPHVRMSRRLGTA